MSAEGIAGRSMSEPLAVGPAGVGLARGVLLQQGVQIVRLVGGLGVLTLLARSLSLAEFGTYTLLLSIGTYVVFVRQSIVSAAVIGVAEADSRQRLDTVMSTGFAVYALSGIGSAVVLTGIGLAVLPVLNIPDALLRDAQIGVLGLGAVTALGWPAQIFDDALRGLQRFTAVSFLETFALVLWVGGAVTLVLLEAPLWALVTLNAAVPLLQGLACMTALPFIGVRLRIRPGLVSRQEIRRFAKLGGTLLLGGVADLVTYSLDRAILSGFRGASAVGLYEGPLQAQSTVRYLNGVLAAPLVPIVSRLRAQGDLKGVGETLTRALRFSMAVTTPFVVLLICLPVPILTAWLGPSFSGLGLETAVFSSCWLVGGVTGVVVTAILTAGRAGLLTTYSWAAAAVNLVVTVVVTSQAGIWGPIVGSMTAFAIGLCWLVPVALRLTGLSALAVLRRALLPAWMTGSGLALMLVAVNLTASPSGQLQVGATILTACLAYWVSYYLIWCDAGEKQFAWDLLKRSQTGR